MSDRGKVRLGLVGLGLAGASLFGAVATERVLVRRIRALPDVGPGGRGPGDAALSETASGETALSGRRLGAEPTERVVVSSDGARLRVIEAGRGRPVVLLHGITLSADIWHNQQRSLPTMGFRTIAVDLRGHGRSGTGTGPTGAGLDLARLATDVREILEELDLHDVILVGHSMGGMVSMRMLSENLRRAQGHGRVSALALVATSANPLGGTGLPGARLALSVIRPLAARTAWISSRLPGPSLPANDLAFLLTRVVFGERPFPSQIALTEKISAAVPAKVTAELIAAIVGFDEAAALDRLDLPTSVIVGARDVLTPVRHARSMAEAIAGSKLVILDGCGHMVMLERPGELDAALVELAMRSTIVRSNESENGR